MIYKAKCAKILKTKLMRKLQLSVLSRSDIKAISSYTAETYGLNQANSYARLIEQSLADIEENPEGVGTKLRPELGGFIRSYAISLSRKRSKPSIKSPRHIIIYTLEYEDKIFVLRVLHDSMDIARHAREE